MLMNTVATKKRATHKNSNYIIIKLLLLLLLWRSSKTATPLSVGSLNAGSQRLPHGGATLGKVQ